MESEEFDVVERVDSSTSSTISSIFGSDMDLSSNLSITSGSSGEIVVVPVKKCVGRNDGVTWGSKAVIGRRKEMEDAVAVVPEFMVTTCDHVGGCVNPAWSGSSRVSPVRFFGVYDGHGGSQVRNKALKLII